MGQAPQDQGTGTFASPRWDRHDYQELSPRTGTFAAPVAAPDTMKLTFLGTRGYIDAKTDRHRRHSSMLVEYYRRRVMIDCGKDWLGEIDGVRPHAILVTHAHPDHAFGLEDGAPCPVYATQASWDDLSAFDIDERKTVEPRSPFEIGRLVIEAFTVEHSTRCPAVGYRIKAGRVEVFYVPDLVYIHEREAALDGVRLYIGDGATLDRPMVRKQDDRLIGHTPFRTQLTWCRKLGVPEAIVTHCGSQIVEGDERTLKAKLGEWAEARDVEVDIAHDGMERVLR